MCKRTVCTEYPHEKILCDLKCMSVYLWAKNHDCSISAPVSSNVLDLPKNPQWSSPIQQHCPNKLCTSRLFCFSPLSALLPYSFLPPAFPFHCHPLANLAHTIAPNHIWQFKLALFSLSLALQNTSQQNGPCASAAPRLLDPIYLHAFVCMCTSLCVCVILPECYSENKKRGTKKVEPSNDRATLIRLSKAIIAEFQHYSV